MPNNDAFVVKSFATPEDAQTYTGLARQYAGLAELIELVVPASRERSLAITNLQESMLWLRNALEVSQS